jgi:hypothetical protein
LDSARYACTSYGREIHTARQSPQSHILVSCKGNRQLAPDQDADATFAGRVLGLNGARAFSNCSI